MSDQFVGEIQAFPFPFAVTGFNNAWLPCGGQLVPIQQFTALFALIGTYYGGNGTTNFALPNLNGSIAISQGQGPGLQNYDIGETVGSPTVTLIGDNMARHTHTLQLGAKTTQGGTAGPGTAGTTVAIDPQFNGFVAPPGNSTLVTNAVTMTGQNQPHDNTQPTLAIVWCIAYAGIFPSFG
ncbi:tail fiber protein [Bradyrhizobium manausense]|uniref:phage tail protein n=1 Tax=Bradyrhizobium manausense TaxID=989370 RepID=UPI001BA8CAA3|nr:tail fiber protein [Bradyrhizobium manausense]MBR0689918.1 tail fiber protein [Bradyrhizobium manausense]MBR0725451.1 tail fiber protein [Bradyrhizobium manausense]MBR0835180.1 tail fiber protein [Bradyrhizobium manausense]